MEKIGAKGTEKFGIKKGKIWHEKKRENVA